MKEIGILLIAPILGTVIQLVLKFGAGQIKIVSLLRPIGVVTKIFGNIYVIIAVPLYGLAFLVWLIALSKFDLNYAYPFLALNFVFVPLISWLIFGEKIPKGRWMWIFVLCIGIAIIGLAK